MTRLETVFSACASITPDFAAQLAHRASAYTSEIYLDNGGYPAGFCAADAAVFQPIWRFQRNGNAERRTGCNISGLFVGGI